MFNAVLVLGLGMILGKFQYSVLFFLVFASIRSYSGGYHAKNTLKCTIVYLTAFLLVLLLSTSDFIKGVYPLISHISLGIMTVCAIGILSPIKNENKILTQNQCSKYKKISLILSIIYTIISTFAYHKNIHISATIQFTLIIVLLLMIGGMKMKRGDNT
jgi:accessory gene regulator B